MDKNELAEVISKQIAQTAIGKPVTISFGGKPMSVRIQMEFAGGWLIDYTIIPGMTLQFIRGQDAYLKNLVISILPYEGLE